MRKNTITKIIKIEGTESAWSSTYRNNTIISMELKYNGEIANLSFDKLAGPDLYLEEVEEIILNDFDVLKSISKYLKINRKENFFVETKEGVSGCRELYLYSAGYLNTRACRKRYQRANLYISCFDKIDLSQIRNIWIGDLLELLAEADDSFKVKLGRAMSCSKNFIRKERKGFMKYIKPYKRQEKLSLKSVLDAYSAEAGFDPGEVEYEKVLFDEE